MSRYFDSRKNYLKQFMRGTVEMNKPATYDATFDEYYTELTINHDLGYRPLVRAWYDPDNDKTIYPVNGQKGWQYSVIHIAGHVDFMFCVNNVTTTSITFRALRPGSEGAMTGTFLVHYKIYLDPVRST